MKSIFRGVVFLLSAVAVSALAGAAYAGCEQDSAYVVGGFMNDPVKVSSDPAGRKEYSVKDFQIPQNVSACDLTKKGELPLTVSEGSGSTRTVLVRLRYLKTSRATIDCFKPVLGKQLARDHSTPGATGKCK